jgi:hypothetical protein
MNQKPPTTSSCCVADKSAQPRNDDSCAAKSPDSACNSRLPIGQKRTPPVFSSRRLGRCSTSRPRLSKAGEEWAEINLLLVYATITFAVLEMIRWTIS